MHVNFANMDELNDYHQEFYRNTTKVEFSRLMGKLREFEDEVAPVGKDIREFIDKSYTKDLKKRGVTSFVTEFAEDSWRRLSGGEGQ